MGFLFNSHIETPVPVSVYVDSDSTDEALLDQNIWDTLDKPPHNDRIALSVTPLHPHANTNQKREQSISPWLSSLTCWTKPSTDFPGLRIPGKWLESYPRLFEEIISQNSGPTGGESCSTHTIVPVQPVLLSEIILIAESQSSYEYSLNSHEKLITTLCDGSRLFRQGSIITLPVGGNIPQTNGRDRHTLATPLPDLDDHVYRFRVLMTEPTLQGYSRPDLTRFIVITSAEDPSKPRYANGEIPSPPDSEETSAPPSESDVETLEIDENFLASGLIDSVPKGIDMITANGGGSNDVPHEGDRTCSPTTPNIRRPTTSSSLVFQAAPLSAPIPYSPEPLDTERCIFLRSSDLSRVGMFNGDWGVVGDAMHSDVRLSRVFARDDLMRSTSSQALASPVLLSNLQAYSPQAGPSPISIRSSLFGSHNPPIPVARFVTVARVASPYSNDRTYQPFFLHALKDYFEGQKRLVKKGDLIAVGLHAELATLRESKNTPEQSQSDAPHDNDELLSCELPFAPKTINGVGFFKITNLEYDIVNTGQNSISPDQYMAATMGELGCWVDTQITKMVQAGLEHSRVPDVTSYLGIVTDNARSPYCDLSLPDAVAPTTKIRDLAEAALHPSAMDYKLQTSVLLKGSRGIGKFTATAWVARSLGIHLLEINCFDIVGENDAQTEGTLRARFEKAAACAPCILTLRHIDALAGTTQALETEPPVCSALQESIHELAHHWKLTGYPVIVIGTTSNPERIPSSILACFKHEIVFEAPMELERLDILTRLLLDVPRAADVSIKSMATQTAAMVASDLVNLVNLAQSASLKRVMSSFCDQSITEQDIAKAGVMLTASDFETGLSAARLSYSESIGAPTIPNVTWDDVGGLASVKSDILDTIQLPLEHPDLFADGLKKRSGILLYGPPGTGKTLLAKAVATSCSLNFFSVKGPELLNMYIGESEANVRRVFQRARDAKPCVIFFDELDSVAPKRGNQGDSGGVMDRIVSQLLAELDGMADGKNGADVFVIGATNRPDLLDPALLRPGRFDRMLYLGVSDSHQAQYNILQALTRKFRRDPGLDLMKVALQCPFNYTGADFYALCSDAMLKAMSRKAEAIEMKIAELNRRPPPYEHPHPMTPQYYLAELATEQEIEVLVSQSDFEEALRELVPSVSQDEMAHYAAVQQRFANDTINSISQEGELTSELQVAEVDPGTRTNKGKGKAVP